MEFIKKNAKIFRLLILATVICTALIIGLLASHVYADEAPVSVFTFKGTSVRLDTDGDTSGIRFTAAFDQTLYDQLIENGQFKDGAALGMIIVPGTYIDQYEQSGAYTDYFTYFEQVWGKAPSAISTTFRVDQIVGNADGTTYQINAALTKMRVQNYELEFRPIAFYTIDGGATYHYEAYDNQKSIHNVSIQAIELDQKTPAYTDKELDILYEYTGGSIPRVIYDASKESHLEKIINMTISADGSTEWQATRELVSIDGVDYFKMGADSLGSSNAAAFSYLLEEGFDLSDYDFVIFDIFYSRDGIRIGPGNVSTLEETGTWETTEADKVITARISTSFFIQMANGGTYSLMAKGLQPGDIAYIGDFVAYSAEALNNMINSLAETSYLTDEQKDARDELEKALTAAEQILGTEYKETVDPDNLFDTIKDLPVLSEVGISISYTDTDAFSIDENGVLTIFDEVTRDGVTYPIVGIADKGFQSKTAIDGVNLTQVVLPKYLQTIGTYAFSGCTKITTVPEIPAQVTSIGKYAFNNCTAMAGELVIPDSVTTIGTYAFYNCKLLTGVVMGQSVTSVGSKAFYSCSNLTGVYITDLAAYAAIDFSSNDANPLNYAKKLYLNGTLLTDLNIPYGAVKIGTYAFYNCTASTGELTIPDSVTSIGNYAFYSCSGLTGNLVIPDSVTSIGDYAFYSCSGLTGNLVIPDSVTSIGKYAFYKCSGLTGNLVISDSVTSIGEWAFYGCSGLTGNLVIPDSVTSIGNYAFSGCNGFNGTLTIGDSLTSIASSLFQNCSGLTGTLVIPEKITTIGSYAFYGCSSLTGNLVIPDSVTSIGSSAFSGCSGFNGTLTIGDSLTSIASSVFQNCSGLTGTLVIPEKITTIGSSAFYGCSGLTGDLIIPDSVTSIDSSAFYGCSGFNGTLTISNSLTSIASSAFQNCSGLTGTLVIPENIITIGNRAFSGCTGFTGSLTIQNSVISIGDEAFYNDSGFNGSLAISDIATTVGADAFYGCNFTNKQEENNVIYAEKWAIGVVDKTATSITLRADTVGISDRTFAECTNLTNITIPNGVRVIGARAFFKCTSLKSATFPNSVEYIGSEVFTYCSSLESLTLPFIGQSRDTVIGTYKSTGEEIVRSDYTFGYIFSTTSDGGVLTDQVDTNVIPNQNAKYYIPASLKNVTITDGQITPLAFKNCNNIEKIIINTPVSEGMEITYIGLYAFANCTKLKSVSFPDTVTLIWAYAFQKCSSLTGDVYLPSIVTIGAAAFDSCGSLNGTLTLGSSLERIGSSAFNNCSNLNGTLSFGSKLTSIDNYAFNNCSKLTGSVYIPNVTRIGYYAFYNCSSLNGTLTIGNSLKYINNYAFYGCTKLRAHNLTLPSTLTSLEKYAFSNCYYLTGKLTIPSSIKTIGQYAFQNCSGLTSVEIPSSVTSIGNYAFQNCYKLVEVINLSSLTLTAGETTNGYVAKYAVNLITNAANSTIYESGDYIYYKKNGNYYMLGYRGTSSSITLPSYVTGTTKYYLENYVFFRCSELTSVTIPSTITYLPSFAFRYCTGLTSVTLSSNLTQIYNYAFNGCTSLTSITIPSKVTKISQYVFAGCTNLSKVTFSDTSTWYVDTSGYNATTKVTVTNTATNATYVKDTYDDYYWYKK